MLKKFNRQAFSLIELSIVILIIGILVAGVTQSSRLLSQFRLMAIRSQTINSVVPSIQGLKMWLETSMEKSFDISPSEGDPIQNWIDINPTNLNKIIASQPTISRAPTYNMSSGMPLIRFNCTTNYYFLPNSTIPPNDMPYTVFTVINISSSVTFPYTSVLNAGVWPSDINIFRFDSMKYSNITGNGFVQNNFFYSNTTMTHNKLRIYTSTYDNRNPSARIKNLYVNSIPDGTSTFNFPMQTPSNNNFIGNSPWAGDNENFCGTMAEIIIYERTLSNDERLSVENYLAKKWFVKLGTM